MVIQFSLIGIVNKWEYQIVNHAFSLPKEFNY